MSELIKIASRNPKPKVPPASVGVAPKPPYCKNSCKMSYLSTGFVEDSVGVNAKLAIMLPYPNKDSAIENRPLSGGFGAWFLHEFIYPFGLKMDDLLVSHTLRCTPPWKKTGAYPTGKLKGQCEGACRHWDGGLKGWEPDFFVVTVDPQDIFNLTAYYRQFKRDVEKAIKFMKEGYKPILLCGNEPTRLVFQTIEGNGGVKSWRGHISELRGWPY